LGGAGAVFKKVMMIQRKLSERNSSQSQSLLNFMQFSPLNIMERSHNGRYNENKFKKFTTQHNMGGGVNFKKLES